MTTQGQGNSLTFVQGHSDPNFQTSFPQSNTRLFEAKFQMKPPWDLGMKICLNDPGHMTKMAFRPIYGKNLQKLPSSEPRCRWHWNSVYSIRYSSTAKFIQMMTLGWHWSFVCHVQIYFPTLLHGESLYSHAHAPVQHIHILCNQLRPMPSGSL